MKKAMFYLIGNILPLIMVMCLIASCKKQQLEVNKEEKISLKSLKMAVNPAVASASSIRKVGYMSGDLVSTLDTFVTSQYTDIVLGFPRDASGNYTVPADIAQGISRAHNAGVRMYYCIGSYDPNGYENTQINSNRTAYISTLRKFLTNGNFDGLALDFEGSALTTNFSPFLVQLSDSLHLYGKKLSIAIASYQSNSVSQAAYNSLDNVDVMCYDYNGSTPQPHAPFTRFVTDFNTFKSKVPAAKINMGIPFYAWTYDNNGAKNQLGYANLISLNPNAYAVNYIYTNWHNYYDGFPVLRQKIPFLQQQGCGGLMVFHVSLDTRDQTSLIRFINYLAANPNDAGFDPTIKHAFQNVNSGKILDVAGASTVNGANLQQNSLSSSLAQRWTIANLGGGQFCFINFNSGQVMSVYGGSTSNGANLVQWPWGYSANQKFKLSPDEKGYYRIDNVNSNQSVSVYGGSTSDGANIVQWPWGNSDNQKWIIIK